MIKPGEFNFDVYRNVTLRKTLIWKPGGVPANLTGYSATCSFWPESTPTGVASLVLTSSGGGIFLGSNGVIGNTTPGAITLYMTDADVDTEFLESKYFYGLQLIDTNGDKLPFLMGYISLKPSRGL